MSDLKSLSAESSSVARRGAAAAFVAYFLWGTLPVYWKMLEGIPVLELMAHRILWTLAAVMVFQTVRGRLPVLWSTWRNAANRRAHLRGAIMVTINWSVFVWALLNEQVIEASLGYFLVPLINAGLGRIIFKERLIGLQRVALVFAGAGVAVLFTEVENLPWVSLGVAASWCTYGVGRKQSDASAINGLALEMTYVAPIAIGYLGWLHAKGMGTFAEISTRIDLTIAGTGVMSMIPLVLFAYGTRRLTYTTISLCQYVAPTCQFLMGWLVFDEPLSSIRVTGFVLIWIGLVCYTVAALQRRKAD